MKLSAKGSAFENKIQLISGHKFPDIVANRYYGVEVKTSKQNYWKSTGNSVLETTRINSVKRIYLFFGKLSNPLGFKFRKYEECLYDIAVTHSPRYLINMNLKKGDSIFDKMKTNYDELRNLGNPIKPIVKYYRSKAKPGQETWWMAGSDPLEDVVSPNLSTWGNLSSEEKNKHLNEAMALFPEIFGTSPDKYKSLALWLVARHGVITSNVRDLFSSGGQEKITIDKKTYIEVPKIFYHLNQNKKFIIKHVQGLDLDDVSHYWKANKTITEHNLIDVWVQKIIKHSEKKLKDSRQLIIHLLADVLGERDSPPFLKEEMGKCGLKYAQKKLTFQIL